MPCPPDDRQSHVSFDSYWKGDGVVFLSHLLLVSPLYSCYVALLLCFHCFFIFLYYVSFHLVSVNHWFVSFCGSYLPLYGIFRPLVHFSSLVLIVFIISFLGSYSPWVLIVPSIQFIPWFISSHLPDRSFVDVSPSVSVSL